MFSICALVVDLVSNKTVQVPIEYALCFAGVSLASDSDVSLGLKDFGGYAC